MVTRILITWYGRAFGGAEDSVIDLCNYLANYKDLNIIFLCVTSKQVFLRLETKLSPKVKLYHFSLSLFIYNLLAFFIIFFISVRERINIVNVNYRAVLAESLAAKILGKKVISTVRAIFIDRININFFCCTDMIVAISGIVAKRIKELGYQKPVRIIYNGLDLKSFKIWTSPKLRNRQGFYFMARMVKWKRPDWFVRAAIDIHKEYPYLKFILFGEGPEQENIKKIIKENNAKKYIRFRGFISRNDPILKEYGICVLPSFMEPFGKTIIEAVLRNKVVVGTNSGGPSEILKGYDLLFERDNFADLVQKIKEAYLNFDYYYSLISGIKEDFQNRFNMERTAQEYYNLFKSL